eukprot:scaffold3581_cov417-Prasinococcus_capsulatus_cf.AAC.16
MVSCNSGTRRQEVGRSWCAHHPEVVRALMLLAEVGHEAPFHGMQAALTILLEYYRRPVAWLHVEAWVVEFLVLPARAIPDPGSSHHSFRRRREARSTTHSSRAPAEPAVAADPNWAD